MDGSNLVFIVVPIVIPLVLAIGVAVPFIAARDTTRAAVPRSQDQALSQGSHGRQ